MGQRAECARDLHVNAQRAASKSLFEDLFPGPAVSYNRDERILMHTSLQCVAARANRSRTVLIKSVDGVHLTDDISVAPLVASTARWGRAGVAKRVGSWRAQPAQLRAAWLVLLAVEDCEVTGVTGLARPFIPTSEVAHKQAIGFAGEQFDFTACAKWAIIARRRPEEQVRVLRGIERCVHTCSVQGGHACPRGQSARLHARLLPLTRHRESGRR